MDNCDNWVKPAQESLYVAKQTMEMARTTPMPPVRPKHTNIVRPVLTNIKKLIDVGLQVMLKNRQDQYIKIIQAIENIKNKPDKVTIVRTRELVEVYSRQIPQLKLLWEQLRDYYRNLLRDCNDTKNPIPNLVGINISPIVSQDSFRDHLAGMLVLCREALFLCSVDFNGTKQFIHFTDTKLMNDPRTMIEYCEVEIFESNFSKGDTLIRLFTERQLLINLFLKEWGKGGSDLDQGPCPSIYTTLPVTFPGLTDTPTSGSFKTSQFPGLTDTPTKGNSRGNFKTSQGGGNVEDIVTSFNKLEDGAYREMNKSMGQRDDLKKSMMTVQRH